MTENVNDTDGQSTTRREMENFKKAVLENSENIEENNRMIIKEYEKQICSLRYELENYRKSRPCEIEASRNSHGNFSNSHNNNIHNNMEMSQQHYASIDNSRTDSFNQNGYPQEEDIGNMEEDYQVEQLNQVLDKISNLEEKNK